MSQGERCHSAGFRCGATYVVEDHQPSVLCGSWELEGEFVLDLITRNENTEAWSRTLPGSRLWTLATHEFQVAVQQCESHFSSPSLSFLSHPVKLTTQGAVCHLNLVSILSNV